MGIISRLKRGVSEPILRWAKFVPDEALAPEDPKTSSHCEGSILFVDDDDYENLTKDFVDDRGNVRFDNKDFQAKYWGAVVHGVRGFNRYTAGMMGGKLFRNASELPISDVELDAGDVNDLGAWVDFRTFMNALQASRDKGAYVRDRLDREKKDSKPTRDSLPADSPQSSVPA